MELEEFGEENILEFLIRENSEQKCDDEEVPGVIQFD